MSKVIHLYKTDEAIIDGIRNFDEMAGTVAYNNHKEYCIRFMTKMYDDEETIKDIYHDAIIVLIENIRHKNLVLEKTTIQTYLNSICRNQVLVRFKSSNKLRFVSDDELEAKYDEKITDWLEDLGDVNSERMRIISEELKKMKEDGGNCYELLALFYFESRSMDFIAKRFNYTNAENAKNQKSRCQKRLKEQVFNRLQ